MKTLFTFGFDYDKMKIIMAKKNNSNDINLSSAEEFRSRFEKLGLDRDNVAKLCGVKPETVEQWEAGKAAPDKNVYETLKALEELCKKPEGRSIVDRICGLGSDDDIENLMAEGSEVFCDPDAPPTKPGIGGFITKIALGVISIGSAGFFLNELSKKPENPDEGKGFFKNLVDKLFGGKKK